MGGVCVHWLGVQEVRGSITLGIRECIRNALGFFLVIPTFDDTGSLGYPSRRMVYRPSVSTLGDSFPFHSWNMEAELKPTNFSSLLLFRVFLSFLFS